MTPRRRFSGTPEGLEYLAVAKIWAKRMQSRTFQVPGQHGRTRPMFVGWPGMADILAPPEHCDTGFPVPLWIECKTENGRQSAVQKDFEREVVEAGHYYLVARSIDDVREWLGKFGYGQGEAR